MVRLADIIIRTIRTRCRSIPTHNSMDLKNGGCVSDSRLRDPKHADGFTQVCQIMDYDMASNIEDILLQVSEPPRRETAPREICETAGGTPEPHHREVPVSLCNRHATESKAVILQLPNPSLSHLQEIEDRLRSSPKQKCLRDTPSTSHSTPQQADQCLTWLTLRSIYSMPSRPFVIHECITAEGPI